MGGMLLALLGAVGSVGSFFVNMVRGKKAELIDNVGDKAIEGVSTIGAAAMNIADSRSDSWLAKSWRPMTAVTFLIMIISRWLGYQPPHMSPEEIMLIYHFMAILLGGLAASRGLEKVAKTMVMGRVARGILDNHISQDSGSDDDEEGD